jgi:hypothetical protein
MVIMALHYETSRSGADIIGVFVWYALKIDENRRARVKDGITSLSGVYFNQKRGVDDVRQFE